MPQDVTTTEDLQLLRSLADRRPMPVLPWFRAERRMIERLAAWRLVSIERGRLFRRAQITELGLSAVSDL